MGGRDRGLAVTPSFLFSTCSSSRVTARSKMTPGSPSRAFVFIRSVYHAFFALRMGLPDGLGAPIIGQVIGTR
jgi:hypothetical protein